MHDGVSILHVRHISRAGPDLGSCGIQIGYIKIAFGMGKQCFRGLEVIFFLDHYIVGASRHERDIVGASRHERVKAAPGGV